MPLEIHNGILKFTGYPKTGKLYSKESQILLVRASDVVNIRIDKGMHIVSFYDHSGMADRCIDAETFAGIQDFLFNR